MGGWKPLVGLSFCFCLFFFFSFLFLSSVWIVFPTEWDRQWPAKDHGKKNTTLFIFCHCPLLWLVGWWEPLNWNSFIRLQNSTSPQSRPSANFNDRRIGPVKVQILGWGGHHLFATENTQSNNTKERGIERHLAAMKEDEEEGCQP